MHSYVKWPVFRHLWHVASAFFGSDPPPLRQENICFDKIGETYAALVHLPSVDHERLVLLQR